MPVEVNLRSLGNVQIENRNGDIQLGVPDKPGFRIDARTRDGEIRSDFPELKVNNGEREGTASGSVGNPTVHLVINNEHGGIEIRKAPTNGGPKEGIPGGITGGGGSVPAIVAVSPGGFATIYGSNFAPAGTLRSVWETLDHERRETLLAAAARLAAVATSA